MIGVLRLFRTGHYLTGRAVQAAIGLMLLAIALAMSSPADANPRYAALVIDAHTGEVLFSRYADERRYPASITKIMTVYILFEELEAGRLTLDSQLSVSQNAADQPPSKVGVRPSQTISVRDAIGVLMTKSANDVAVVVAENVSGSVGAFAERMTRTARTMGMHSTVFRNPHGLPNSGQYTTARDIAAMVAYVRARFPRYDEFFRLKSYTYRGRTYRNHNRLLGAMDGIDGMKTGYIRASGFNLAATLRRDGKYLIGVVLGGRKGATRDAHMREILTAALPKASRGSGMPLIARNAPLPPARPQIVTAGMAPNFVVPSSTVPATLVSATAGKPYPLPQQQPLAMAAVDDPIGQQIEAGSTDDAIPAGEPLRAGDWVIQIGAFETEELAQGTIARARENAQGVLDGSTPFTETVQTENGTLWRARFAGFDQSMAQAACAALEQRSFGCFTARN